MQIIPDIYGCVCNGIYMPVYNFCLVTQGAFCAAFIGLLHKKAYY